MEKYYKNNDYIIYMIFIHGKYYDIDKFDHPGGKHILELCKNEPDCTALFESYHAFCDMDKIKKVMKNYKIDVNADKDKQLFLFEPDGFYNTCKTEIKNKLGITRENSKAGIEWILSICLSFMLFIFFQYFLLFSEIMIVKFICGIFSGTTLMSLGYNIMHDGSHYGISKYPFVNKFLSRAIQSLLLLNHTLWSYHHCIRHHQYTGNIDLDPDMRNSMPYFRKSSIINKRENEFSRKCIGIKLLLFNVIFPGTMFGQALMYHLVWAKRKILWKMKLPKSYYNIWSLFQYITSFLFCVFEIYHCKLFFIFHLIGTNIGYFIGSAPDHDMYCTHQEIENNKICDWGEMQVRHSANFLKNTPFFTKFYGGINYQIEHHLFPTLSNHKLVAISPIVQKCCKQFNIPYNSINNPVKVFQEITKTYYDVHS